MADKLPLKCPVCPNPNPVREARCPQCDTDLESLRRVWELPRRLAQEGRHLQEFGARAEGAAFLAAAAALAPDPKSFRLSLGRLLLEQGAYTQALDLLQPVLAQDPEHPEALRLLRLSEEARHRQEADRKTAEEQRYAELRRTAARRWLSLALASTLLTGVLVYFFAGAGPYPRLLPAPAKQEKVFIPCPPPGPSLAEVKETLASSFPAIQVEEAASGLKLSGQVKTFREFANLLKITRGIPTLTYEGVKVRYDTLFSYRIRPGDSLSLLAQRFYGRPDLWETIREANAEQMPNPNSLRPGDLLMIPGSQRTTP